MKSLRPAELGIAVPIAVKDIRLFLLDRNETLLGLIDQRNETVLSPNNTMIIDDDYRLVYLS